MNCSVWVSRLVKRYRVILKREPALLILKTSIRMRSAQAFLLPLILARTSENSFEGSSPNGNTSHVLSIQ